MGRPRSFDTDAVVRAARDAFVGGGYAATSVDDLLRATGLQRASLYSAFGSKRGVFLAALAAAPLEEDLDLLVVALMEATAGDHDVTALARPALGRVPDTATALGTRVLARAGLDRTDEEDR